MNKNILIAFLLVLVVFAGFYLFGRDREGSVEETDERSEEVIGEEDEIDDEREGEDTASYDAEVRRQLNTMTIDVPDLDTFVTLEDGEATFDAGAGIEGYLKLGDAYTLARDGDAEFALIHSTLSTGGSGTFDYVFAIEVTDTTLTHKGSAYLGDRIIVEDISAEPGANELFDITVSLLTRLSGEPLSDFPTVPTALDFTLNSEGQFGI
jgi:hypothetical protein